MAGAGQRGGGTRWRAGGLVPPNLAWLALFMLGPLLTLLVISFRGYETGRGIQDSWTLSHYVSFLTDPYHVDILARTMKLGLVVTLWCLVLGHPLAYGLSPLRGLARALRYFVVLLPLLTSAVVRTFGWMILLSNNGFLNRTLIDLGLTDGPVRFMYGMGGIIIALVQVLLPFIAGAGCRTAEHRSAHRGSGAQPWRRCGARVREDHAVAVAARHAVGRGAGVHAGGQRL